MANMKKISQINLQGENYAIDVHNDLKAKLGAETGDNLKVTTKGYVDAAISAEAATRAKADEAIETKLNAEIQRSTTKDAEHDWAISDEIADRTAADTALDTKKLDKAPDGKVALLNENQKINLHYLSDAIVGQVKFGGTVSLSNVDAADIVPSALLKDAAMQASEFTPVTGVGTVSITADSTVGSVILQNKNAGEDETAALNVKLDFEGFYFITSASGTFADIGFETGDWLIACGGNWQKVENTDAVTSVNGQLGAVKIDTGIMTINKVGPDTSGNFNLVAGENITITKGTNKLTIAATVSEVSEQVQADWNENDPESPAYIKNRTHYFALKDSISESTGFVYGTGGQFTVEESNRFCAQAPDGDICFKPGVYSRTGTGFAGTASEIVSDLGVTSLFNDGIYLSNPAGGPNYCYIVIDGLLSGAEDASLVTLTYTETELKQLDAKYIPVDNETIRIENGKLVGAASSNVDLTGDVTIGGNLEVGGDLKFNGDFEIASLDAQSVKVNGKRVLVEGDATGGSVAGITTGSVENSLEFFDGVASAEYAIAIGTNEKDAIIPIVGSTLANMIKVNAPTASGVGAIATGGGAEATSAGALAMGSLNRVGVTGFYWSSIGTNTITLSTAQGRAAWTLPSGVTFDWQVGDTISIVNDSKYPACAKITGISGHVITVDKLPFSEAVTPDKVMPDDYTIFACYKKDIATEGFGAPLVTQERWYPRSGCVTIGWAGTAFGIENLVSGSAGFAAGWNNWAAGDFGAAFGRDNIASYASFVTGVKNIAKNKDCIVAGANNEVYSDYGIAFGLDNTVAANNAGAAAIGWGNSTTESCQLVVGKFADAPTKSKFVVGNGSSASEKSNAFIVHNDGRVTAGKNPTEAMDLVTKDYFENNALNSDDRGNIGSSGATFDIVTSGEGKKSGTIRNSIALGLNNTINNDYAVALGYKNTTKGCAGAAIGCELNALPVNLGQNAGYGQVVVGRYNATDKVSQFIVGSGTGASNRKNALTVRALSGSETYSVAVKDTDAITLGYLKNNFTGGGSAKFPTKAADGSPLQDGAVMVYRNGTWVAENPPTAIYTGEVE